MSRRLFAFAAGVALVVAFAPARSAQPAPPKVTTPKAHFGFNLGDDYHLANYEQYEAYLAKLSKESDRIKIVDVGPTAEKRSQLMAIVTSPENHKKLERLKAISRLLARAEGVSAEVAGLLAAEGKAVVWIDGGLHASETLCAQAMTETIYQLVAGNDAETRRILDALARSLAAELDREQEAFEVPPLVEPNEKPH